MKTYEATERAYKNGYEQGKKDALKPIENDKVMERLTELLRNGILAAMDDEDRYLYTDVVDYMMARGVTIATDNNVGGNWIPVSERLPEDGILVLCIGKRGGMFLGEHPSLFSDGTAFFSVPNARCCRYATHWCYLPEPPRGE